MLLVLVFTLVNIVLFFLSLDIDFPFSLFTPYVMAIWAYQAYLQNFTSDMVLYVCFFVLVLGGFLASYLLALTRPRMMIVGLIIYLLDTAYLFYVYLGIGYSAWVIDAAFHLWVILSLAYAVYVSFKIKTQETDLR